MDPGVDDAIALFLALSSPELRVQAVTVVAGNIALDQGAENALRLLSLARRSDIPVAKGAAKPLHKTLVTATRWHGPNGLAGLELPRSKAALDSRHAVDLIIGLAHRYPHDITIVATGPLTNVAVALRKSPSIERELSEIIIMGGSTIGGNQTAAAEFNFFVDPDAAKIVFDSGVPITMVGLNAATQTRLVRAHVHQLAASRSCVGQFVAQLGDFLLRIGEAAGVTNGSALYDPLALGMAIDKTLATTTVPMRIDVDSRPGLTNGATIFNSRLTRAVIGPEGDHLTSVGSEPVRPNADVPTVIAADRFLSLLMSRLSTPVDGC